MSKTELQLPALHHKTAEEDFKKEFFEIGKDYIPGSVKLGVIGRTVQWTLTK